MKIHYRSLPRIKNAGELTVEDTDKRLTCKECVFWMQLLSWPDHGKCSFKDKQATDITIEQQLCNECISIRID